MFSLAYLTIPGCSPPEQTEIAARAGYDFVSYRSIFMGLPGEPAETIANDARMLRNTKAALAASGIRALDIELARIVDGVDVKTYTRAFDTAAELGVRHVISSVWTTRRQYVLDSLTELCQLAARFGLTINLEFVTWAGVATLQEAVDVIRAVNQPNCGLLIDTLHFNRSRVRPEELDAVPREWFHMVHLCDAAKEIPADKEGLIHTAREDRLDPGMGGIDLAAILHRIPEVPYSLEIPNLERSNAVGFAEHARLCLEHAREYMARHPREVHASVT
jgi:sugar phosphate isomerase/epimerase